MTFHESVQNIATRLNNSAHFLIPVVSFFLLEIILSFYYPDYTDQANGYDYSTLVLLIMAISFPFMLLDPPLWFGIYMTTFSHFLYFRGLFTFSLVAVMAMFLSLFAHKIWETKGYRNNDVVVLVQA